MVSRTITFLFVLMLLVPGACAVQNVSGQEGAGMGSSAEQDADVCILCMQLHQHHPQPASTPEPLNAETGGSNASVALRQQEHQRLQAHVRAVIAAQQRVHAQELENMSAAEQKVYRNQNAVRLAVHTLLSLGERDGGIGGNVSAIASEFNSSVQATIRAEERIRDRSGMIRFFAGGDEVAAADLLEEVQVNGARIRALNRCIGECDCNEETKAMLTQQVQNMEQEMARLQALARNETSSKGVLGWLWK
jgi:hypothetical protein